MYNNPFFTNITDIGDLNWEEIIVDDACPIFFTLISNNGKRYISVCCELYEEQRWLISPISNSNLIRMLKNEISMRDAFLTQNEEKCVIAHWSKDDPTLKYDLVDTCDLPDRDLPVDEMLEAEEGEFEEYIQKIQNSEPESAEDVSIIKVSNSIIYFNLTTSVLGNKMFYNEKILEQYVDSKNGIFGKKNAKKHKEIKRKETFKVAYNL